MWLPDSSTTEVRTVTRSELSLIGLSFCCWSAALRDRLPEPAGDWGAAAAEKSTGAFAKVIDTKKMAARDRMTMARTRTAPPGMTAGRRKLLFESGHRIVVFTFTVLQSSGLASIKDNLLATGRNLSGPVRLAGVGDRLFA